MIPDHYKILGVMPDADDAAIRASYRALMRLYHPDRNADPHAHAHVRAITAAFAVLGEPAKRAAYDAERYAQTEEQLWLATDRRAPPPPPLRRLGIASIAIALAMTLAFAVFPHWQPGTPPPKPRTIAANSVSKPVAPPVDAVVPPKQAAPEVTQVPEEPSTVAEPVPLPAPAPVPVAALEQPDSPSMPPAARHVASSKLPTSPSALPAAAPPQVATIARARPSAPPAAPTCRRGYSRGASGKCSNDRLAQVAGMATGFLEQSMAHSDWHKQQLLLSASNRNTTSRMLCRSDECLTAAYLREMRDITTIMQGKIPTP